ncbi:MAG: hypothetical protein ED555_10530 [Allomuricauda sp.]|nr:MAG: hypothetical protein ED555_10530 [Allomuricauda sp.]
MKQKLKNFTLFALMGMLFLLQGCDEIAECVFGINPEIHDKRLAVAFVGEPYEDIITAEVSNEVFDNDYIYNFDVFGDLPPGLRFDFDRRAVVVYGIPEEEGTYSFTVELFVENFDEGGYDGSPTCNESTERQFLLRVAN